MMRGRFADLRDLGPPAKIVVRTVATRSTTMGLFRILLLHDRQANIGDVQKSRRAIQTYFARDYLELAVVVSAKRITVLVPRWVQGFGGCCQAVRSCTVVSPILIYLGYVTSWRWGWNAVP